MVLVVPERRVAFVGVQVETGFPLFTVVTVMFATVTASRALFDTRSSAESFARVYDWQVRRLDVAVHCSALGTWLSGSMAAIPATRETRVRNTQAYLTRNCNAVSASSTPAIEWGNVLVLLIGFCVVDGVAFVYCVCDSRGEFDDVVEGFLCCFGCEGVHGRCFHDGVVLEEDEIYRCEDEPGVEPVVTGFVEVEDVCFVVQWLVRDNAECFAKV